MSNGPKKSDVAKGIKVAGPRARDASARPRRSRRAAAAGESWAELMRERIKLDARSVYRLAKDAGIEQAALQRFATGDRSLRIDSAEKLARVLGLELRPIGS